jgi:hypothetical protein
MPINRFSTVGQSEYTPQHVPLPFEAIGALGEKTQKAHDAAIDDTYKLKDLMTKVPAIYDPNLGLSNIKKKQELDAQFAPKIDELTNKIMAGDTNAPRELEQLKRDFVNNPIRQELENSYVDYQAYKKDMMDKKDAYAIYKDPYRNKALINEAGELQPFRYSGMGEKQDHATEARAQMSDIAKMGYDSKNSYLDPNDGNIYTKDSHGKYVKDTRVRQLANQKAVDFSNTQKGQDYLQLLQYQNPNATPQELMQGVSDYLFNAGSNQIFSDVGGGTGVKTTALSSARDQEKQAANLLTTNEQGNAEVLNLNSVLKGLGLDDVMTSSGDWLTKQTADVKGTNVGVSGGYNMLNAPILGGIIKAALPSKSAEQIINEGYKKIIAKHKELGLPEPVDPITGKATGKYKEQLYNYAIELAKRRSTTSNLQQSTIQGMNKAMLGPNSNIHNMEFYIQGDESSNAKITNEEVKNMPKNASYTGIDFFGPNQAGWKLAVSTKDKDGATTDKAYLAVPRDKTFEEDTRAVHNISRGALDFAKTGKVNPKYFDKQSGDMLQGMINANKDKFIGTNVPKLIASSVERNRSGEVVVMGSYVDNSTGSPLFKAITYYPNRTQNNFIAGSLDEVQANKTTELQSKGSLNQYNIKFTETIKPSDIAEDDSETNP